MRVERGWVCAVCVAWPLVSARARAADPPKVLLALDRCPELEAPEIRRIISAELGTAPADAGGRDVTEVSVRCDDPRVVIRVKDPLSRKTVQRSFDLGMSDPIARPRLVSIAATELVLASWAELRTKQELHVEPEGPVPSAVTTEAARQIAEEKSSHYEPKVRTWYDTDAAEDRNFRIVGLASLRSFFGYHGTLYGGGVRVGEEHFRFVSWSADALFERGMIQTSAAAYDVVTTTLGGWLLLYAHSGPITGRIGAGLRAGLAGTSPRGAGSGSSTVAPWGWPLGAASLTVRLAGSLVLDFSGEAGYVVLPLEGAGDKSLSGGWFSGQVGLGFMPWRVEKKANDDTVEASGE